MKRASEFKFKHYQIENFRIKSNQFRDLYSSISRHYHIEMIQPLWFNFCQKLAEEWAGGIPDNFLSNPVICETMSSTNTDWANRQLEYLIKNHHLDNPKLIEEDSVGDPYILNESYMCSCNTVHHLYHLHMCLQESWKNIDNIVEFGGGYGRFPILFNKFFGSKTYTIIDLPIFSILQYLYVSSIGDINTNLITSANDEIRKDCINFIPIGLIDVIDIKPDMFVAMWSLGESTIDCCNLVYDKLIKNTPHVMMATHYNNDQRIPAGQHLMNLVHQDVNSKPVNFVGQNSYFYR